MMTVETTNNEPRSSILIAGGRDFNNEAGMLDRIQALETMGLIDANTKLICGMARGADLMAYKIFKEAGLQIEECPADWDNKGKSAGYIRNAYMANIAEMALIFWDGRSKGTKHMIDSMVKLEKDVYVVSY